MGILDIHCNWQFNCYILMCCSCMDNTLINPPRPPYHMDNPSFRRKKQRSFDPKKLPEIKGFPISKNLTVAELLNGYAGLGLQASHIAQACDLIRKIKKGKTPIYLTITSNIVSSGMREIIAQLCKEKAIAAIITTTGAIEEDLIKTKGPFRLGSFDADDSELKKAGMNRIGNILVADEQYCEFEDFHMRFLGLIHSEQQIIAPSKYIKLLGLTLNNPRSILYQASKNDIPIFCPGIVDGAMGDHIYFFNKSHKKDPFIFDVNKDVEKLYDLILQPDKIAGLIVGGGIAKHHLIGAAILRDGLDYAIYITTSTQYDGSLSGARPKEAVSWNKLKDVDNSVCIEGEASIVLPLLAWALLHG